MSGTEQVPQALQGSGALDSAGINVARFPPNLLLVEGSSITLLNYGIDPLSAAHPVIYQIGAYVSYCVLSSFAQMVGNTLTVSLIIPSLVSTESNCVFASIAGSAGSIPSFFFGSLQGQQCVPGAVSLPWSLLTWVPTPPVTESAPAVLSIGAIAALGVVVPFALMGAFVLWWRVKRPQAFRTKQPATTTNTDEDSASNALYGNETEKTQQLLPLGIQ
jgi:hypothetical protein